MARYLLDTNVCLRLADEQAAEHFLVIEAVRVLLEQGNEFVTVPQNLYEFWSVATRPTTVNGLGWNSAHTRSALDSLTLEFPLLEDTPDVLINWLELVTTYDVKGKQVHDARLVAAMQTHDVVNLLTLNVRDFERYSDIKPVHPNAVEA